MTVLDVRVHDVRSVVENPGDFDGQTITVRGFVITQGGYYFLSQGEPGSAAARASGHDYSCAQPGLNMIWFSRRDLVARTRAKVRPLRESYTEGRRVLVRGVLRNRAGNSNREIDLGTFGPSDLALGSIGPLERVEILELSSEACGAPDSP